MAKRKRLTGPLEDYLAAPAPVRVASVSGPPIARVAGDASVSAALDEVSRELTNARNEGRLVVRVSLESIDVAWLVRDRTHPGTVEDPDFTALVESLKRNGQRTPIEVVDMGNGRYGLISGWRRLTALRRLHDETGEDRFATVLAFLRQPKSSEDAYVAMVEENEIRLALSYYERARIAAKSVEAGVFDRPKSALQTLFASASRAKRSKIGSFLGLYQVLGDEIHFPQALTERLGLALSKVLEADEAAGKQLVSTLKSVRPQSPEAEQSLLSEFVDNAKGPQAKIQRSPLIPPPTILTPATRDDAKTASRGYEVRPGVFLTKQAGKLQLSGPAVGPEFCARLEAWIKDGREG